MSVMIWGDKDGFDSDKAKNIHQTELLVDLRDAILQIGRHFQSIDPKNTKVVRFKLLSITIAAAIGRSFYLLSSCYGLL